MRWYVVLVCALTAGACKPSSGSTSSQQSVRAKVEAEKSAPRLPVKGVQRLSGNFTELRASPDGSIVSALKNGVKPAIEGVPPPLRVGELWIAASAGGTASKVADKVSNLPGGWLFTPDSKYLLVASQWDQSQQLGELLVIDAKNAGVEPVRVGTRVSYFVPSDDGTLLAWVENGVISVGSLPAGPFRQLAGEVSTAEFSADGHFVYFKRRFAAAGGLYQVDVTDPKAQPRRILDQVSEYTVLRSNRQVVVNARTTPADREFQLYVVDASTLRATKLTDDAFRYRVSHDGRYLAWKTRTSQRHSDVAEVGELWLVELPSGKPRKVGSAVKDFEFAANGSKLAFRDNYLELPLGGRDAVFGDGRVERVGDLSTVALPDGEPKLLQKLCPNFLFSPDGASLAWTARIEKPDVTRRLLLMHDGAGEPVVLKDWLYEYQFRAPGDELYFRADCERDGRACSLLMVPSSATKDVVPRKVAGEVYGVRFSVDGSHAMLASAHLTDETFDLSLRNMKTGSQQTVDQFVEWPGVMLGADGSSIAYLVREKGRAGVYVAQAP